MELTHKSFERRPSCAADIVCIIEMFINKKYFICMLTKTDLQAIDRIVKKRVREEIEVEIQNVKNDLQADIKMSQIRILGEINNIKDRLKNVEIKINKIQKDLKYAVNFLDKEFLNTQKRVERTEKHLGLEPLSP